MLGLVLYIFALMKKLFFFAVLVLFTFSITKSQINLKNGLVAYYALDGHAVDSGPNALNGTIIGSPLSSVSRFGKPNTAFKLDGSNDAVMVPHNSKLNLTADKSISLWYKIESSTGLPFYPIILYKPGKTDYPTFGIFFHEDPAYGSTWRKVSFIQGNISNINKETVTAQNYQNYVNQWVHIAATYSTGDGYMRIYFNGSISDSLNVGMFTSNSSTDSMSIGRGRSGHYPGSYFKGHLDDIRIYDRPLNKQEVDSLYKEHFFVYSYQSSIICGGDSLLAGGKYRKTAGQYFDTISLANKVDSVVITNLTVNPSYLMLQTVTICSGGKIVLGGKLRTAAGIYYDSLKTDKGCDSIIKTTLVVNHSYYIHRTINLCSGQTYLAGGANQTATGTYYDSLLTDKGCDSIITTTLIINPNYVIRKSIEICQGDSLVLGGKYRKTTGIYYDSLLTGKNCDSIIITNLTVNPVYSFNRTAKICNGDSIYLEKKYRKAAGIYYDTLYTRKGCDSIIITHLIINSSYLISNNLEICKGDSVLIAGSYRYTAGLYSQNLNTVNGCDSIIETTLEVNPVYVISDNFSICGGDSVLVRGNYIKTAGVYYDTLSTIKGCDSILVTKVTVNTINPLVTKNAQVLIAQESGAVYQWLDCDNGNSPIFGETQQSFIATSNGNYAVAITKNFCSDTSICYSVTSYTGIDNELEKSLSVYPNPAKEWFTIDLDKNYSQIQVTLITITGKQVAVYTENSNSQITIPTARLTAGVYLLEIVADGKQSYSKIMVE